VDGVAVPGGPLQLLHVDAQVEVVDQAVEAAVPLDVRDVLAEGLPRLALDRVRVRDDTGQTVVLGDPLGRGLGPDPRDAGEVVAALPHQRRQVRVALRWDAVPGVHRVRCHAGELGDPAHRVEHGDVLVDELEGVPVTGDDEHVVAVGPGLPGQGADDVVGLVALGGDHLHAHRAQHLADEGDLPLELGGADRAARLVLRVLASRNVCLDTSKATARCVGSSSRRTLMSIEVKP
jgi:hypothetical protein